MSSHDPPRFAADIKVRFRISTRGLDSDFIHCEPLYRHGVRNTSLGEYI